MNYFSELVRQSLKRTKESSLGVLGITDPQLRAHLQSQMESECGKEGSFLASPLFEHMFGWEQADPTVDDLLKQNLLSKEVVDTLDKKIIINIDKSKSKNRYRFGKEFHPYLHQLKSWETLLSKEVKSVVITSGTGSGKTECFMIPVLEDLYREFKKSNEKLIGVRAIFLYPLNALINSQRERLNIWTQDFKDSIRFCLYNGNTENNANKMRSRQSKTPNEILSRELMRSEPAPILVTNGTMLEYMLIRNIDSPIIEKSKKEKSLRWIILDEAHSYIGSQAAELSMQLRRVLQAFGVEAKNVRFVATSATIADKNSKDQLQEYLASLANVPKEQVLVIDGYRSIPALHTTDFEIKKELNFENILSIDENVEISKNRFNALCRSSIAVTIRDSLVTSDKPLTISNIKKIIFNQQNVNLSQNDILKWIDLLTGTKKNSDEESFLKVRAHLFQTMLNGLWSCIDKNCSEKQKFNLSSWQFGSVYVKHRFKCECGAPVCEISFCNECNEPHLLALEKNQILSQRDPIAVDEFSLQQEVNELDDELELLESNCKYQITISAKKDKNNLFIPVGINKSTGLIGGNEEEINLFLYQDFEAECSNCGYAGFSGGNPFRRAILGAPFYVANVVPTLLEYCPDAKKNKLSAQSQPGRGKRLITFTDSRQGTARLAVRMQQEAERNKLRGLVFEKLKEYQSDQPKPELIDISEIQNLKDQVNTLRNLNQHMAADLIEENIKSSESSQTVFNPAILIWKEMVKMLSESCDMKEILAYNKYANPEVFDNSTGSLKLAEMLLIREFARRPKRQNSLETQGIIKIGYQGLNKISILPSQWEKYNLNLNDWKDFLKVALDFYVRENSVIKLEDDWRVWIGTKFATKTLRNPDSTEDTDSRVKKWPQVNPKHMPSRLVKLLVLGTELDLTNSKDISIINDWLKSAWMALTSNKILKSEGNKFYLSRETFSFSFLDKAFICPITNKLFDTTFKSITPYLPRKIVGDSFNIKNYKCETVDLPHIWNFDNSQEDYKEGLDKIRKIVEEDNSIIELRKRNLWTDINDRTVEGGFYYRTAEHSAQQSSDRLISYEDDFKKGKVNVLNCSTTMEMGVDIGGISAVVMNNVPPHPANYLQRSGRAGRGKESRAISYTLCKNNPHDAQVFENPAWPFITKIPSPKVLLNSSRLVQRHVNSLLLSVFLRTQIDTSSPEKTKLNLQWFFEKENDTSICNDFKSWLARHDEILLNAVKSLVNKTARDKEPVESIIYATFEAIEKREELWLEKLNNLKEQEKLSIKNSPFEYRISQSLIRHRGEYLLKELAAKAFLPGYGFPTDVVTLNTNNIVDYRREKEHKKNKKKYREDNISHLRGFPSRNLAIAIREYAPGSQVVIDGRVFKSAGISLNWQKIGNLNSKEPQKFDTAWRCSQCGSSGLSDEVVTGKKLLCTNCQSEIILENMKKVIEPIGFVTNFFDTLSNDISSQKYIPVQQCWVSIDSPKYSLPNPETGFMAYGSEGAVFYHSSGEHDHGFAVCLGCGRSDSMTKDNDFPFSLSPEKDHSPIISTPNTKDSDGIEPPCVHSASIQKNIHLGYSSKTDVFELTLRNPISRNYILDNNEGRIVAMTLAIALRNSLAEILGISTNEIGYTTRPSKFVENGQSAMVIQLYDNISGGAGFASSAAIHIQELLIKAYSLLNCPNKCTDVCSACLLDSDSRHDVNYLNRTITQDWLGVEYKHYIKLSEKYEFLSDSIYCHTSVRELIAQYINQGSKSVYLWISPDIVDWDLTSRTIKGILFQYLSINNVNLSFVLPDIELDELTKQELFRMSVSGVNFVHCENILSKGHLVAMIDSGLTKVTLAAESPNIITPNNNWLVTLDNNIVVKSTTDQSLRFIPINTTDWFPKTHGNIIDVEIKEQLNGEIKGFGKRFWKHLSHEFTPLKNALTHEKVIQVEYNDRYLQSPWYMMVLGEIIDGLPKSPNMFVEITTLFNKNARLGRIVSHDWNCLEDLKTIYQLWFQTGVHVQLTHNILDNRFKVPHRRILKLIFSNGKTFSIKSDQGVGYWRLFLPHQISRLTNIYFESHPEKQIEQLLEVHSKGEIKNSAEWSTDFIVTIE